MENLWFSYTNYNKPIKEEKKEDTAEDVVLGKRRNKPLKYILDHADGYTSESGVSEVEQSESDISDWESTYKNHQRKKKLKPTKKLKLAEVPQPEIPPVPTENGQNSQETEPMQVKEESALYSQIKVEPMDMGELEHQNATNDIKGVSVKLEKDPGVPNIAGTLSLAEVKDDDLTVVILSSDEEEDVKPQIAKLKLRDVSTLLKPATPLTTPADQNLVPNNISGDFGNNNMFNNLNVVIPPTPTNAVNSNPMMRMNQPMSVQVPPNLYQVRPSTPRQRMSNPRQVMVRQPIRAPVRGIAPRATQPFQRMPVRMPVPKPMTPKKPVPKPLLMSPQEWAKSPPPTSPSTPPGRGRTPVSSPLRGRSPITPPQQRVWANNTVSPRNRSPMTAQQGRAVAPNRASTLPPKALFSNNSAPDTAAAAEGKLIMGPNETGTGYGYQIVLPDGGIRYLTDAEVSAIKRRNNGTLPRMVRIPPDGSFL